MVSGKPTIGRLFWLDCYPSVMNITGVSVGGWRQIRETDRQTQTQRQRQTDRNRERNRDRQRHKKIIPFYLFILSLFACVAHTV